MALRWFGWSAFLELMSALRVVLLAEGNGEVGPNAQRGPGSPIAPLDWAPGHAIFARAIASKSRVPEAAVQFIEPLRTGRGAVAKGSNLLHARTLRQLLSYLPASRPDLIIVLVDADGVPSRKRDLEAVVNEFESCCSAMGQLSPRFSAWSHRRRRTTPRAWSRQSRRHAFRN